MLLLIFAAGIAFVLLVADSNRRTAALNREIEKLRRRVDELDRRSRAFDAEVVAPAPELPPRSAGEGAPLDPAAAVTPVTPVTPAAAPLPTTDPPPPGETSAGPHPRPRDMEQLVGGVWLQNAGAVLLLAGFFFLILWGYATGRFGPGVLVIAGVLAGLGLVWRGARMRTSVRGVGHALIGVGAGVVWLAIYLGHFRLGVLAAPAAFVLVVLASAFTGGLGLRYRAQGIAALGVVGAHLPNVLEAVIPLYRFALPAGALLGYLAAVNAVVFGLAARAGWSALALASVLLSAGTWIGVVPAARWSWPVEIGLAALFAGLGLSPVPRLVRAAGSVRPIDLAVIAVAPLALLAASQPMFELAHPVAVAMLLLTLAALYLAVLLWVDARRPERDLWKPLTAAAILFLTAAIERLSGPDRTALAWTIEGVALVLIGLRPRGEWLRWCGHVVIALGGIRLLGGMLPGVSHPLPVVNASAITAGLAIAALLFAASRVARARERLGALERIVTHAWDLGAHVLLMAWLAREAHHLAWALERDGGVWRAARDVRAAGAEARYWSLFAVATSFAWFAQAAWLARSGLRGRGMIARVAAVPMAAIAAVPLLVVLWRPDCWGRDLAPLVHRDALLALGAIALVAMNAARLARGRAGLHAIERRSPEVWAGAAALMLLVWFAREADHLARVMLDAPGPRMIGPGLEGAARAELRALSGTLTSVGWLIEAVVAFVLGWWRRSPFLRWMGMALIGVTVLKFLLIDLANTDPFWRFMTAIGAGAAMMALSYVYQRSGAAKRPAAGE
jgi:uncharacterized membrane protein